MRRNNNKQVRLSDDELALLKENAKLNNMKESEYIRMKICHENTDYIRKSEVAKPLLHIRQTLDREESKGNRAAKIISKEFEKLWRLL